MRLSDIYRHAFATPDHLAIVNSGEEVSYRVFAEMIERARACLAAEAIPRDGVVWIKSPSRLYDYVLQYAARSSGYTTVITSSTKVFEEIRISKIAAIISLDRTFDVWDERLSERGYLRVRIPVKLLRQPGIAIPHRATEPMGGSHILYTSGTTGSYKKIVCDDRMIEQRIERADYLGIGYAAGDVAHFIDYGPWTSIAGLSVSRTWLAGATVVFDQRQDWFAHFFNYPVTSTYLVNTYLTEFAKRAAPQPESSPEFQVRLGGGFPNSAALKLLRRRFRSRLVSMYGGTEFTPPLMTEVAGPEDLLWLRPAPGETFEIVNDEGQRVPSGMEGNLRVRLHSWEPSGYFEEPEATATHYRYGYFYPGDIAVQRSDGRVRIVGRQSEVLIIAGAKVPARPHEERFEAVTGAENVRLFTRQSAGGEHALLIVLEGDTAPPKGRLQALIDAYQGDFDIVRLFTVSVFPRGENGMGKVDRRQLLQQVQAGMAAQVGGARYPGRA